jgi:serine/threonine protein kinase
VIGQRLGPYEIIGHLGAGGMGDVYRARDDRLGRDVAIKLLPEAFLRDGDRLARFDREARALAALSHPNIGAIYGVEEAGDRRGLVLELVEGPTLAEAIAQTAPATGVPLGQALSIGRQIADALEAAHDRGIVHRDLKPANIKIAANGFVKVLDFGLAKATLDGALSSDSAMTINHHATASGLVVGTPSYMSPEQARGLGSGAQTDIWAFGCVLYEILTARIAFDGRSAADTIAAVIERQPDWARLPATTPAAIRRLLRRCLEKDTRLRLRSIGDARLEIDDALSGVSETLPGAVPKTAPVTVRRLRANDLARWKDGGLHGNRSGGSADLDSIGGWRRAAAGDPRSDRSRGTTMGRRFEPADLSRAAEGGRSERQPVRDLGPGRHRQARHAGAERR